MNMYHSCKHPTGSHSVLAFEPPADLALGVSTFDVAAI